MSEYHDRGMMKWRPFASLVQYKDYYNEMLLNRRKIRMPELSEEQKEDINTVLNEAKPGETIRVRYFVDGFIRKKDGVLLSVDTMYSRLILDNLIVPFKNLLSLSVE